jgi:hypothetical protein
VTWWQVLVVFVAIPAAIFAIITVLVLTLAEGRVPDGLANATAGDSDPDSAASEEPTPPN